MLNNDEKINQLLADKEFFKKITSMKTAEEVQSAFEKAGAEVSVEEVRKIGSMINAAVEKLSEGKLETVSGGEMGLKGKLFLEGVSSISLNTTAPVPEEFVMAENIVRYPGMFVPLYATGATLKILQWAL